MSLFGYIEQGGPIMYLLLVLNIIGFALLLWKGFVLIDAKKNFQNIINDLKSQLKGLTTAKDSSLAMNVIKDEVQMTVHALESGLNTIKIIASIAPLLGLLGTVLGILSAFKVISEVGLSNPSMFAGGIAMALLTTVGGLIVAIPHFVGYNYLVSALDNFELNLEKKLIKELYGTSDVTQE
ncbi:MAG: MotA/TolQ/ExbB proton channel family protein [Bacteriovoracaceae bacterium]|jgi:biopolymer transport protein ExbB|nr:biopolymer transporter ExbB [Halobacteriovoraceae bacterium]MDP7321120.1 MotA/TolQ/ExbB proton channel family protein [Bacteriovoracaceae bacterium]|tara:strand:- start:640 stop:1182 length:543 start_codon:yes stop_codon:yes gene_type:complete